VSRVLRRGVSWPAPLSPEARSASATRAFPPHTAGPNLHVHTREDEASYIISGVLTVVVGDRTFEAGPETLVWLPRG
jgi:mannose-6-phosphate isomerase-like protein (cupin superfamily)